ncbi:MAG: arsenic efflux protein [Alphaproteobacteria bacterium]|nr:arsenic efflux protein [Alphaproteobacteria bacterium]
MHRATSLDETGHRAWKLFLWSGLVLLSVVAPQETSETIQRALSDAYLQVSVFVGGTLIVFYFLENRARIDTAMLLKRHARWQVPIAAIIGALPGCGGAIIIITQYVLGRIGFGSMVAVLTATMGDAAFLLLAREPQTALLVMGLSIVVGTISGWIVERVHGPDFMRIPPDDTPQETIQCGQFVNYRTTTLWAWYGLMAPGLALGLGSAFQQDTDAWFGPLAAFAPSHWIGYTGALFCLLVWALLPGKGAAMVNLAAHPACRAHVKTRSRIVFETSFVTAWVVLAFLVFELGTLWSGIDLAHLFKAAEPLLPAIGVLVGFIPGCGPQIIVTTLYLGGLVPFSAQIGNAISNDGDALFPAIAMAPKTAFLATLYTAIPALIVAYGFFLFGY